MGAKMTAIALTIAGSDSGGGAGIQADLKTFSALGVYGASVLTALTAQNTIGVQGILDIPAAFVRQQLRSVLSDLSVNAIKIGMLSRVQTIAAIAEELTACRIPIVLDPVMIAASGDPLLRPSAIKALTQKLIPLATLITPNLHEAAALTGEEIAGDEADMLHQAKILIAHGAKAVLIKGGHGDGPESVDFLVKASSVERLAVPRIATDNVHGTGCTLSSAIAAGLARGLSLEVACHSAKDYVTEAIAAAHHLNIGKGHGPSHHFVRWWD
jgi:hydroxymethylpyrimidine/phosphomethylpyrimidine kinase